MKRRLFASNIFKFDSPDLFFILGSVLVKMLYSVVDFQSYTPERVPSSCLTFTATGVTWSVLENPVRFDRFPNANTQKFIILGDLRFGAHGRVWLATSCGGSVCVIKFCKDIDSEFAVWKAVYKEKNFKPRIQSLIGSRALVLPYIPPITRDELLQPAVQEKLRVAIKEFASFGFQHNDLKLENMGIYRLTGKVCLFDFGNVSKTDSPKTAMENMVAWLDKWIKENQIV